jgi:dihydrofolate reductase
MINAIFAIDEEGGMGLDGSMPWPKNLKDLNWFKVHTIGHIVVMGRGTWDATDMPSPLPNRTNWVVTSTVGPALDGA